MRARAAAAMLVALGLVSAGPLSADPATEIVTEINRIRAEKGLSTLSPHPALARAAQRHAADMANKTFMDHTGSDGSDVGARAARAGYRWSAIAENIAASQRTAIETVRAWLASPGHRANMLNPNFKHAGAALAEPHRDPGPKGYRHYWVAVFARAWR